MNRWGLGGQQEASPRKEGISKVCFFSCVDMVQASGCAEYSFKEKRVN